MRRVEQADYAGRLALYQDTDPWGRAIIEALTPVDPPRNPGDVVAWSPLADAIAQNRDPAEVEVIRGRRELDRVEAELTSDVQGLDALAGRRYIADNIGVGRELDAPRPLGGFSEAERKQALSDVVGYLNE